MNYALANAIMGFVSSAITIALTVRNVLRSIRLRSRTTEVVPAGGYLLPNLKQAGGNIAASIQITCEKLANLGKPGAAAASRLEYAAEHLNQIGQSSLQAYLDPGHVREEVQEEASKYLQSLIGMRNVLVLVPLFLTWGSLGWAALQYQHLTKLHPSEASKPFIAQWQSSFGTGNPALSFSSVALLDGCLLLALIVLSITIHWHERRMARIGNLAAQLLNDAIRLLQGIRMQVEDPGAIQGPLLEAVGRLEQSLDNATHVLLDIVRRLDRLSVSLDAGQNLNPKPDESLEH